MLGLCLECDNSYNGYSQQLFPDPVGDEEKHMVAKLEALREKRSSMIRSAKGDFKQLSECFQEYREAKVEFQRMLELFPEEMYCIKVSEWNWTSQSLERSAVERFFLMHLLINLYVWFPTYKI